MDHVRIGSPPNMPTDLEASTAVWEYWALKQEQLMRIGDRDNYVYAQVLAIGAIFGFLLKGQAPWPAAFAVPFVSGVLASLYVANDQVITQIGDYIQHDLSARIVEAAPSARVPFGWESFRLRDPRRQRRKKWEAASLKGVFLLPSVVAMLLTVWRVPDLSLQVLVCLPLFLVPIIPYAREVDEPMREHPRSLVARD